MIRDILYAARLLGTWALVKASYVPGWFARVTFGFWAGALADALLVTHHFAYAGDTLGYIAVVAIFGAFRVLR